VLRAVFRIRDPDSFRSGDPDPDSDTKYGSGSRRANMTHKNRRRKK
jgi:hypothetical protein